MFRRHPLLSLVTFVYLGVVAWITLGPQPFDEGRDGVLWRALDVFARYPATDWLTYQRVEFGANVAMFLPVGVFFVLLFGRRQWWLAIGAGVALTCSIEFVQRFLPDRVSDVSDIIANSIGTVVGVILALLITWPEARRVRRSRQTAARAAQVERRLAGSARSVR